MKKLLALCLLLGTILMLFGMDAKPVPGTDEMNLLPPPAPVRCYVEPHAEKILANETLQVTFQMIGGIAGISYTYTIDKLTIAIDAKDMMITLPNGTEARDSYTWTLEDCSEIPTREENLSFRYIGEEEKTSRKIQIKVDVFDNEGERRAGNSAYIQYAIQNGYFYILHWKALESEALSSETSAETPAEAPAEAPRRGCAG